METRDRPTAAPDADELLVRRAGGLRLELLGNEEVAVFNNGSRLIFGPRTLEILDYFGRPHTLREAIGQLGLRSAGPLDLTAAIDTVMQLISTGLLESPSGISVSGGHAFDSQRIHVAMLGDRKRTDAFIAAIAATVRPGDVVVDLGTGTGILAMAAARQGARKVFAIEAGRIGEDARRLVEANDLKGRVEVLRGWSTATSLSERCDLLVSETIGNDPLEEGILISFLDARSRMMKPHARMIPRQIAARVMLVDIPRESRNRACFTSSNLAQWDDWYGFDFSPLLQAGGAFSQSSRPAAEVTTYRPLSAETQLFRIDLETCVSPEVDVTIEVEVDVEGMLGGMALFFELDLAPGNSLTNSPFVSSDSHWRAPVAFLQFPRPVRKGEMVTVSYSNRAGESHLECS